MPILEAERLQRSDLCFFFSGEAVHRSHHRENRNKKEHHRKDRAHGLSFLSLTRCAGIRYVLILRKNEHRLSECAVDSLAEILLFRIRNDIYLRIEFESEGILHHRGRDIRKAVCIGIGHKLRFVPHAYEVFTGSYKSADLSGDLRVSVNERECIADGNAVCICVFLRNPDPVRTVRVVSVAVNRNKR